MKRQWAMMLLALVALGGCALTLPDLGKPETAPLVWVTGEFSAKGIVSDDHWRVENAVFVDDDSNEYESYWFTPNLPTGKRLKLRSVSFTLLTGNLRLTTLVPMSQLPEPFNKMYYTLKPGQMLFVFLKADFTLGGKGKDSTDVTINRIELSNDPKKELESWQMMLKYSNLKKTAWAQKVDRRIKELETKIAKR